MSGTQRGGECPTAVDALGFRQVVTRTVAKAAERWAINFPMDAVPVCVQVPDVPFGIRSSEGFVLPAWPLCPPGRRPLSCRRDRRRSSVSSAVGFASPSPGGGLPLLDLPGPSRRSSSAMRAAWAAFSARSPAIRKSRHASSAVRPDVPRSPDARNRRRLPGPQACVSRLPLFTAASAILAGRPVGHAAPIARQDHDGCAACRMPAWREPEQLLLIWNSELCPKLVRHR